VADDGERVRAGPVVVLRREEAARRGAHAEHVEVVARHVEGEPALRHVVAGRGEAHVRLLRGGEPGEGVALIAEVYVVGERRRAVEPAAEITRVDLDEPRRIADADDGAQQYRVDEAEDGRVRADAERERQHRRGREARTLQENSDGVAQIMPNSSHHSPQSQSRSLRLGSLGVG
jgi:hypothetical protein